MDKLTEILVVDDDENFATECVDFLKIKCKVGATMALTAKDAEEKVKTLPIKVILLDYDMPVNGLELFPKLQSIDSCVEIVFISAVATDDVLFKSEKFPFATRIAKGTCFNELPELIPTLLLRYAKKENNDSEVFYTEYRNRLFSKDRIEYSIHSYNIINKEYIFPDSWHTTQMIHVGEKMKHEEELNYEEIFNFTNNFKLDSEFNLGIDNEEILQLKLALSTKLENNIKSDYSEKIKVAINRIREISLSDDGNHVDNSIVARYYDFANVYLQIKIRINKFCTCCNSNTILLTTAYFPIPRVAYRIREYFNNKEPKVIDSGFYETGFSAARLV